jgi:hypothetical protein
MLNKGPGRICCSCRQLNACMLFEQCTCCKLQCRLPNGKPQGVRGDIMQWAFEYTLGGVHAAGREMPLGEAPPKAGLCTVLFNPFYKFIFIKNTKVAGTSVFTHFGGDCNPEPSLDAQVRNVCKSGVIAALANLPWTAQPIDAHQTSRLCTSGDQFVLLLPYRLTSYAYGRQLT